jgi:hypothetical protein
MSSKLFINPSNHTNPVAPFDQLSGFKAWRNAWINVDGTSSGWRAINKVFTVADGATNYGTDRFAPSFGAPGLLASDLSYCAGVGDARDSCRAEWSNPDGWNINLRFYTKESGIFTLRESILNDNTIPIDGSGISRHDFEYVRGSSTFTIMMKVELEYVARGQTSATDSAQVGTSALSC